MLDWDDLKYFLAMTEEGSLSAAARKLNISQPTLSRRLSALEENIGVSLFARTRHGLELTDLGERMINHVHHMKDDVHAIERMITGQDESLKGSVIISAMEHVGTDWLVDVMLPFREQLPGIQIGVKIDNTASDLLRREADIALRMFRPEQSDLIARKTVTLNYGYYASKKYIDQHGEPTNAKELLQHKMILPDDTILRYAKNNINRNLTHKDNIAFRSNSLLALGAAVRAGYGIGAYSCFHGDTDDNLIRIMGKDMIVFSSDIWLVSHAELKRSARIRAVYDYLGDKLMQNKALFAGV